MIKKIFSSFTPLLLIAFTIHQSSSQCVVTSSLGYQVGVSICPTNIVVSTSNCPWSYNYNVRFTYNIAYGNNPSSQILNTLQTQIFCNNGQLNGYYSLPLAGGSGTATTVTNPSINYDGTAAYSYGTSPSCTSANLGNINCTSMEIIIGGPGISHQTVTCSCGNFTLLPVEFLDFKAEAEDNGNLLTWDIQSEKRNAYYSLFFSEDGTDWEKITDVNSLGDTDEKRTYTYFDQTSTRRTGYYKLSQTDENGWWNELSIAYVTRENSELNIYPNPSTEQANIYFTAKSKTAQLAVYSNEGKLISNFTMSADDFSNSSDGFRFEGNLPENLSYGVYFVQIIAGDVLVGRSKWIVN